LISAIILFASIASYTLGIIVLLKNPKKSLNILFAIFAFFVAIWDFSNFFVDLFKEPFFFRGAYALGALVGASGLAWIYSLCRGTKWPKVVTVYLIGLFFAVATYINGFIISKIISITDKGFVGAFGFLFPFFSIFALFCLVYGGYLLVDSYRKSVGIIRLKLKYITFGLIGFGTVSVSVSFILPLIGISGLERLDSPSSLIFVASSAYAMIKPRLSHK